MEPAGVPGRRVQVAAARGTRRHLSSEFPSCGLADFVWFDSSEREAEFGIDPANFNGPSRNIHAPRKLTEPLRTEWPVHGPQGPVRFGRPRPPNKSASFPKSDPARVHMSWGAVPPAVERSGDPAVLRGHPFPPRTVSDVDRTTTRDALPITLTFGAGTVDAVSFLGTGGIFTANMTGNTVFLAPAGGQSRGVRPSRDRCPRRILARRVRCGKAARSDEGPGAVAAERYVDPRDRTRLPRCVRLALVDLGRDPR